MSMIPEVNCRLSFLLLSAVVLVADQVTKAMVRANMYLGQSIPPEGTFRLTYVRNPYGAFGFGDHWGPDLSPIFFVIGTVIVVILIIWLHFSYLPVRSKLSSIGLGLILGGAMGNLIDRIWHGEVIDFIDVRLWGAFPWPRWPTFNIADASLSIGIVLMLIFLLIMPKDMERHY
jgi:signal peptidase II